MPGKIAENNKLHALFLPERLTSATVYWNGGAITTTAGILLDTKDFDELHVALGVGTILGETATLSNSLYESDTDDPTNLSLISGSAFTDLYSGNDEVASEGSILVKNYKRYIGLKTEITTTSSMPLTIDFAAIAILGKPDSAKAGNTLDFDL